MRFIVATPAAIVVDSADVAHVRAEDETGAFGILEGHAEFLTVLVPCVVTWRDRQGREGHVAVRGGVLAVRDRRQIEIATREAVGEETLQKLGESVLARFRAYVEAEEQSRTTAAQLQAATIRQLQRYLDAARGPIAVGKPAAPVPLRSDSGTGDGG